MSGIGPEGPYDQANPGGEVPVDRPAPETWVPEAQAQPLPEVPMAPAGTPPPPTPRRRRSRHRVRTLVLLLLALVVVVVAALAFWVHAEAAPTQPLGRQVVVTVRSGEGANQVATELNQQGVVGSTLAYRLWHVVHGTPAVEPGRYAFRVGAGFASADATLSAGPNVFAIDVPPGFTVRELADRVGQLPGHDASHFASVAASGAVRSPFQPAGTFLDGLLGTGTYLVEPGESDTQLLTAMVGRFNHTAAQVGLVAGANRLGMTPYQVVTVASIVEKEGVLTKNLGPVARVILNRLSAGMPLQMDSTVLYAEGRDGGTVTSSDLDLQTPYNTYRNHGLTPTPIAFPSTASLEAAINPPTGSWLYFVVVDRDGTEAFATTYAGQLANEALAHQRGLS